MNSRFPSLCNKMNEAELIEVSLILTCHDVNLLFENLRNHYLSQSVSIHPAQSIRSEILRPSPTSYMVFKHWNRGTVLYRRWNLSGGCDANVYVKLLNGHIRAYYRSVDLGGFYS